MKTQYEKATALKELHEGTEAFVIPNPWDVGSARVFEALGFEALATTSSGFAYTLGRLDGTVTLDEKMAHCRLLSAATEIPVSADLEHGFGQDPTVVAKTILRVAEAGAVGGSIEDYSREKIYDFSLAVERIVAAVEAARSLDFPFSLTARAEGQLRDQNDLEDTIRRLQAFEAAGADVLYAPGLKTLDEIRQVLNEVGKPLNVLAVMIPGVTVAELAELGVRRISIGGALAQVAYGALVEGAKELREDGRFGWLGRLSAGNNLAPLLSRDSK